MKMLLKIVQIVLLFCSIISCKKPGCFEAGGALTNIDHSLAAFDEIILKDNINLVLTQDSIEKITITAPEHIQPNIILQVQNNVLTISNGTECGWLRNPDEHVTAKLSLKNIRRIDYRGSGNITNTGILHLDALQIESSEGAGNIELSIDNRYTGSYIFQENAEVILHGKTESCYSYTNARGKIDFSGLAAKKMVIEYGSLADTHINVTDQLDVIIYYKGNLFYRGNPVVTRSDYYSSGRLIHEP
jgi:hypothetical protein